MGVEEPKGLTGPPANNTAGESSTPFLQPQHHLYGTFQGVACYSQPPLDHTVVGFPPPLPPPPPTVTAPSSYYYPHGYQAVTGYVVADVRPLRESPLCCCGVGLGWLLFISGFFFAAIPWYIGALVLLCGRVDYREKPGLVACMIASVLTMIAIVFGVTGGTESW
ncbi:hypothetical protein RND81_06G093700 [Saponaria officinalis]|uniref:60S ribosomal protein L18a-like protein n=1 Tax=Saponaria officinalis TaxID=3572 RepID=A0AAW1K8K9_SAPOF